jgi:hypothetical protein
VECAALVAGVLALCGLYTLQPNEAAILQLFGAYRGTSRVPGLRATNPFYTRRKLSLRARKPERRQAQGQRQARQPDRDRRRRRLARRRHGQGRVRRRRLRALRQGAERGGGAPPGVDASRTTKRAASRRRHAEPTLLESADVVARALESELQARSSRPASSSTRRAVAPRLRAGDRAGDAAPAAGGGDHRARQKIVHGAVSMVQMALAELSARRSSISTTSARRRWCPT